MKKLFIFLIPILVFLKFNIVSDAFVAPDGKDYKYVYDCSYTLSYKQYIYLYVNQPVVFSKESKAPVVLKNGTVQHISSIQCCSVKSIPDYNNYLVFDSTGSEWSFGFFPNATSSKPFDSFNMSVVDNNVDAFALLTELEKPPIVPDIVLDDIGWLVGFDKLSSVTTEMHKPNSLNEYMQNIQLKWNYKTTTGFSLFNNDIENLEVVIKPSSSYYYYDTTSKQRLLVQDFEDEIVVDAQYNSFNYDATHLFRSMSFHNVPSSSLTIYFDVYLRYAIDNQKYVSNTTTVAFIENDGILSEFVNLYMSGGDNAPFSALSKRIKVDFTDYDPEYIDPWEPQPDEPILPDNPFDPTIPDMPLDDLVNGVKEMIAYVALVPYALGSLLSFMPSWVLAMLNLSFSLTAVLLIYKLIRG